MTGGWGITMQDPHGQMLPEIGYHIRKDQQRKGYAVVAATACIRYAFENYDWGHSDMKYTRARRFGAD